MNWQQVLGSSNVAAIAYDPDKKEAWVRFHSGAVYVYSDVGPGIWDEFLHSGSKGRYVQIQLKRAHKARREADYVETGTSGKSVDPITGENTEGVPGGNKVKNLGYHD